MKIEFLPAGADASPLIRLFHFRPDEAEWLHQACRMLADGESTVVALHDQPWVESVNGCRLERRATSEDAGVTMPAHAEPFVLALSSEGWREVEGKLVQLLTDPRGWNWLTNDGDVRVLFSRSGHW